MAKADKFDRAMRLISACSFDNAKMHGGGACIPAALVVRDFLRELGFNAQAAPVALRLSAAKLGQVPRELMVGSRDLIGESGGPGWDGHLVVTCRGALIDPSFGQCRRPWWSFIPDVAIVELIDRRFRPFVTSTSGKMYPVIARVGGDDEFEAVWVSTPNNTEWKLAPAAKPERWRPMVDDLLKEFRK